MAGKRVISAEVGAELGSTYQQVLPELLRLIKRLFAGGINAVVMHGLPYSGEVSDQGPKVGLCAFLLIETSVPNYNLALFCKFHLCMV